MWFQRLLRFVWWAFAALVVTLAVMLSAARLLLPSMSEYREQLQSIASNFLDRPVQIGALDAAWYGFSPVLRLQQVSIQDKAFPGGRLEVGEVQVALDLYNSLRYRQWRTAGINVIDLELELKTSPGGEERSVARMAPLVWLLQQRSVEIEQLALYWSDPRLGDQPALLDDLHVQVVNEDRRHQIALQGRLPAPLGGDFRVAADFLGQAQKPESWKGRGYLNIEQLALGELNPRFVHLPVQTDGKATIEVWAGFHAQQLDWGAGSLQLTDLALLQTRASGAQSYAVDNLSGRFRWQGSQVGWRLAVADFIARRDGRVVWPSSAMQLQTQVGEEVRIQGSTSHASLEELGSVLPLLPWTDIDALEMVERLRPKGLLQDVEFELALPQQAAPRVSARARFEDLGFESNGGLPEVSGLSGSLEGNLQAGYLYLDTTHATLNLPHVFPKALNLSRLRGRVRWQRYAELFRVQTEQLRLESEQLGFVARWQLDWPYAAAAPWLDLQLALDDLPLSVVSEYLPAKVMNPKAVAWLQNAFDAGTAIDARLLLQGELNRLPFDHNEGVLEARFNFLDMILDYHPQWGQLDELAGAALFNGRSMQITGTSARILHSPVERVVARIEDLSRPVLQIDGTVGGTLSAMLDYVGVSPLGKHYAPLLDKLHARGDANLQIGLTIPLVAALGKVEVDGKVSMSGNDLLIGEGKTEFRAIHGELLFDEQGVTAKNMQAELFDHPVQVSVYRQGPATRSRTVVDVKGKMKPAELAWSSGWISPYLEGSSRWQALLYIPTKPISGQPGYNLQIRSDLEGVAIGLPEPFAKKAAERRALSIDWVPGQESSRPIEVRYADEFDAKILLADDTGRIRKAGIRLGKGLARLPARDEILLGGDIANLNLAAWLSVFGSKEKQGPGLPPVALDLRVRDLSLYGYRLADIYALSDASDPGLLSLRGGAALGTMRWSQSASGRSARLELRLQHLHVSSGEEESASVATRLSRPSDLPELDVHIADVQWNDKSLGSLTLVGQRTAEGHRFKPVILESEALVLNGQGVWRQQGGVQSTSFSADIQGGQLGKLFELFGDSDSIKGGQMQGRIQLNWPGSPAEFDLKHLEGDFNLEVSDGRLEEVKEGPAKLLHLISLNSLQRRLSLDFSDLFKEGFSFDKMKGHFVVLEGDAYTNDFRIKGPSAKIDIAGRTGLVARDYDQLVTVTPELSSSLPIAGVIAGGPVVGAAVLLAERLVGDEFNRMGRVQYQVTGSWDQPVYRELEQKSDRQKEKVPEEEPE